MVLRRTSGSRTALSRAVAATVEPLEVRKMLSTVTNVDSSGDNDGIADIKITGTSGTDKITIFLDPLDNFAFVFDDKNGNGNIDSGESHFGSMPETFDVSTSGGNDTVNVELLSDLYGPPMAQMNPSCQLIGSASGKPMLTTTTPKTSTPVANGVANPAEYYAEGVSIYVDLGSGNDNFKFFSPTSLPAAISTKLSAAAGFIVDADPDGADIEGGGDMVIQVDGGNDNDTINFDFSRTSVIGSEVQVTSNAGSGNDTVTLTLPNFRGEGLGTPDDPEEGIVAGYQYYYYSESAMVVSNQEVYGEGINPSNVNVAFDLGAGTNSLTINATTLVAASDVHIDVDGGSSTDKVTDNEDLFVTERFVDLDGGLTGGIEQAPASYVVDVELGSGNDTYMQNADFSNTDLRQQELVTSQVTTEPPANDFYVGFGTTVAFNIRGDSGNDTIKVKDVDNGLGPEINTAEVQGNLTYNLWGGDGDDNVQFDTNPGSQFAMEGGDLKVLVSGDNGNDFVRIDVALLDNDVLAFNKPVDPADLTLSGGSGNDTLGMSVELVEPAPTAPITTTALPVFVIPPPGFFGPRGYPLLDGGSGTDKYDTEGNVVIVTRGAETLDESIEPAYIP